MSYYSDDDEIDIHLRRGRTASPVYDHRPRHNSYYSRGETQLEISRTGYERSRSRGYYRDIERDVGRERPIVVERPVVIERDRPVVIERDRPVIIEREREKRVQKEKPATPQSIVINNRIENHQEEDDYDERDYRLAVGLPARARSRSRRRESEARDPGYMSKEEYELERTRKELERFKLQAKREEEEKLLEKEMELKRLREEIKAEEDKKKKKEDEERAIREYKAKEAEKKEAEKKKKEDEERAIKEYTAREAERIAKEKKEKEEREAEYKRRLEEDLRKSGMDDRQIAIVLKKDKDGATDLNRPTYTRMARRYLSIETLRELRIDFTLDTVGCSLFI